MFELKFKSVVNVLKNANTEKYQELTQVAGVLKYK